MTVFDPRETRKTRNPGKPHDERSIVIAEARSAVDMNAFATLVREYAASIDGGLGYQGLDAELAALPGKYASPTGSLLLARVDGLAAGCVAMRPLATDGGGAVCEMKRMYVKPEFRGLRLGRLLAERLILESTRSGYTLMRLDSSEKFHAAIALYTSLGFRPIPRYNDDPQPCTVWMELRL